MALPQTNHTKALIMEAAMRLFSERGFHAVTVKEIAAAVGIRDASLYNHFSSKQAIFDAIVDEALVVMKQTYSQQGILFDVTDDVSGYSSVPYPTLLERIQNTFEYLFDDTRMKQLRHLLVISQFESEKVGDVYRLIFVERPLDLQKTVFVHLMATGEFEQGDPHQLALEFYGPLFLLMHAETPWATAKSLVTAHFESFYLTHATRKELS